MILFLYLSARTDVKTAVLFDDQRVGTPEVFAKPCQCLKRDSAVALRFDVSYINQLQRGSECGGIT